MTPPSCLFRPLALVGSLLLAALPATAGSIERIPVTPEDLAAQLGMELEKFEAKFDAPVYATLNLTWKQPGDAEVKTMQHSTSDPDQYHDILFVRKDLGQMQLRTGGSNAKQARDIMEMNVRFGNTGFFYRDVNPFAKLAKGESFQSWTKQQSREALPLDQPIPLYIAAGPSIGGKPINNLMAEYAGAPAYVVLKVTFSRTAPPPVPVQPAPAAPAGEKPAPADAKPAPAPAAPAVQKPQ